MDQKISRRIPFVSFLMACVIVAFHCYDGELEPISAWDESVFLGVNNFFSILSRLALCWFFSLSGFLLYRDYDLKSWAGKVKRRFFSLLVPFLVWELAAGILNRSLLQDPGRVLSNIFLLQKWPPIGPLWYMYAIFLFALLSPVPYLLLKWKKPWGGGILLLLLAGIIYWNDLFKGSFVYHFLTYGYVRSIINYLPAYLTGCYFGIRARDREYNPFTGCVLILLGALMINPFVEEFFAETVYCVLPILMLHAFPVVRAEGRIRDLFGLSFLVYAIHGYPTVHFTPWIRNLVLKITPETWVANLAGRLVMVPVSVMLAVIVWLALSAVCPPLLKIITGGRVKPWCRTSGKDLKGSAAAG